MYLSQHYSGRGGFRGGYRGRGREGRGGNREPLAVTEPTTTPFFAQTDVVAGQVDVVPQPTVPAPQQETKKDIPEFPFATRGRGGGVYRGRGGPFVRGRGGRGGRGFPPAAPFVDGTAIATAPDSGVIRGRGRGGFNPFYAGFICVYHEPFIIILYVQ